MIVVRSMEVSETVASWILMPTDRRPRNFKSIQKIELSWLRLRTIFQRCLDLRSTDNETDRLATMESGWLIQTETRFDRRALPTNLLFALRVWRSTVTIM